MTVKNYIVSAVRPIQDGWMNRSSHGLHKDYMTMWEMRSRSLKKFVQEPFEEILWTEPAQDCDHYNMANWHAIRDLWHSEPCNIFWAGADTMMVQPTEIFNERWNQYRLFNYTDPRSYADFPHYFNDDVQYYPHTMSHETWQIGEEYLKRRESAADRNWGFDQNRHNAMFWGQDIPAHDRVHPEMNWMAHYLRDLEPSTVKRSEAWNGCLLSRAHIIHFCASRGSQDVIQLMQHLSNQLEI